MIANIKKGSGFSKVLEYTLDEDKEPTIISGNLLGKTVEELNQEFLEDTQNSKIKKKLWFSSLSLSREEKDSNGDKRELTSNEWGEIAERYVKHMGFENSNYVAIKHNDTDHSHIHIIASRIDFYGKTVSDSRDYKKAMEFCRDIEKEKGLIEVNNPKDALNKNVSQNEYQMMKRTQELSIKEKFKQVITDAIKQSETMTDFIEYLQNKTNLQPIFNVQKTGRVAGVSYLDTLTNTMMKGSDLGKRYSFAGLQKSTAKLKGLSYDNEKDDRAIRSTTRGILSRENSSNDGRSLRSPEANIRGDEDSTRLQKEDQRRGNRANGEVHNSPSPNTKHSSGDENSISELREISRQSGESRLHVSKDNRRAESSNNPTQQQVPVSNTMGQNLKQDNRLLSDDTSSNNSALPDSKVLSFTQLTELLKQSKESLQEIKEVKAELDKEEQVEKEKEIEKPPQKIFKRSSRGMEL